MRLHRPGVTTLAVLTASLAVCAPSGAAQAPRGPVALSEQSVLATSPGPFVTADLNGDGSPDVITATGRVHQGLTVLFGDGQGGGFKSRSRLSLPSRENPNSVAAGDLNGDGHPDLVAAGLHFTVLLNDGHGGFSTGAQYSPPGGVGTPFAIEDVTGDGSPDLVYGIQDGNSAVDILPGNGDGTFGAPISVGAPGGSFAGAVANMNGDSSPDIVAADYENNQIEVIDSDGAGGFDAPRTTSTGTLQPFNLAVGDVNADGYPDVVVDGEIRQAPFHDEVAVYLGGPGGSLSPAATFPVTGRRSVGAVALLPVAGQTRPDIAVATGIVARNPQPGKGRLILLHDGADGSLHRVDALDGGTQPNSVGVADMNGDGAPDLVVTDAAAGTVDVFTMAGRLNGAIPPVRRLEATRRSASRVQLSWAHDPGVSFIVRRGPADSCPATPQDGVQIDRVGTRDGREDFAPSASCYSVFAFTAAGYATAATATTPAG